ncbi:ComEC/Rec2 family competence protein [Metabacillus iocasae]|uniref:Beta-lactamase superfamily II metal-dependent hydrolase n=1 Tax=Priestia iocasae TaxID=2291674 RepID=A0ABS2QVM6_9BACI|nr:hypothetical protein [Metabacillus iocasae]MBM7703328.1 beta-lactamase superfamily II metal-dependent hydrolase [Metabacillus iocasae]
MSRPFIILLIVCVLLDLGISNNRSYASKVESVDFDLSEGEAIMVFFSLSDGEATLIKDGTNHHILINTGSAASKEELYKWMNMFGIKKLDEVIITKQGAGFDDNLMDVINRFSPKHVYAPNGYQMKNDSSYEAWKEGKHHQYSEDISVRVLHNESTSTVSMDIIVTYGENRILYMTNNDSSIEKKLTKLPLSDTDVLKVANYGGGTTTSQPFLEKVDPQAAIIFETSINRINPDLLERLYEMWIDIHYVKQVGTVVMKMTKYQYEIISISESR